MVRSASSWHEVRSPTPGRCAKCCLTPRSSRAPTAGHQAPATGTVYIFCGRGLASHRWFRLTSNVRLHRTTMSLIGAFHHCSSSTFGPPGTRTHASPVAQNECLRGIKQAVLHAAEVPKKVSRHLVSAFDPSMFRERKNMGSNQRFETVAHQRRPNERASSLCRRRASYSGSITPTTRQRRCHAGWLLNRPARFET